MNKNICPICKQEFIQKKSNHKYCSIKCWKIINKQQIKEYDRKYHKENPEYMKIYLKEYKENNKEQLKKYLTNYNKERKLIDSLFAFKCNVRSLISRSFKCKGLKKTLKTEKILGCTIEEFKIYIEEQFYNRFLTEEKMSLDNYGEWEIHHKSPLKAAKTEEDVIKLDYYKNLQPLWKEDHKEQHIKKLEMVEIC